MKSHSVYFWYLRVFYWPLCVSLLLTLLTIIQRTMWRHFIEGEIGIAAACRCLKTFQQQQKREWKMSYPLQETDCVTQKLQCSSPLIILYSFVLQSFLQPPNQSSFVLGTLQTIPWTWSLFHFAHTWYQRPWKFGAGIGLAFLLWMGRCSKGKWSSRSKTKVWMLECQIQCCSEKIPFCLCWVSSLVSCLWHLDGF